MSNDIPLAKLKEVRQTLATLTEEEQRLNTPQLTDLGLLPKLYQWFKDNGCDPCTPLGRRKFLFLVLCLYSVGSILGDRMPPGLRPKLCELFPSLSACTISNNIFGLDIEYFVYSDFRDDIDRLYVLLQDSGLIPKQKGCLFEEKRNDVGNVDN